MLKSGLALGSGVLAGVIISRYAYRCWQRQRQQSTDEGLGDELQDIEALSFRILVLGLDDSGKSAILETLRPDGNPRTCKPTEGFNVVPLEQGGDLYNFWEIGGRSKFRQHWSSFTVDTDVLLYVIDAANASRFHEAFNALHQVLVDPLLTGVPVVIAAHKQDIPGCHSVQDVKVAMGLDIDPPTKHKYYVLDTSVQQPSSTFSLLERIVSLCNA